MRFRTSPDLARATVARARALRREMTPAERALRTALRANFPHVHFRYQAPIGPFYADIACHGARLIVELDGSQHHDAAAYDAERTAFLEGRGYKVLRFWNNQVLNELDGVLALIASHLPSPPAGEGAPKGRMGGALHRSARSPCERTPSPTPPRKGAGL